MNILLVDDDDAGRAMLALTLRQAGLQVAAASSGEQALGLLKNLRYDVMITDAKMLPMNGFALAAAAKSLQPKLRVVMISAVCDDRDLECTDIEKCFPKPVAAEELFAWIARPERKVGTRARH